MGAENCAQTQGQVMMKVMGKEGPRVSGSIQKIAVIEEVKDARVPRVALYISLSEIRNNIIRQVEKYTRYWRIKV
jgi:hypothetical protein